MSRAGRAVLVDDGLATGATMRVAIQALRKRNPARVVAAVPVAAPETRSELSAEADEMICAATPQPFIAVGPWYEDFSQTTLGLQKRASCWTPLRLGSSAMSCFQTSI